MDTIAEFISQKDRIAGLQLRLRKVHNKHEKIKVSRNRLLSEKVKLTNLLVGLQLDENLKIDDIDLAALIFVDAGTIIRTRHAVKRARNENKSNKNS